MNQAMVEPKTPTSAKYCLKLLLGAVIIIHGQLAMIEGKTLLKEGRAARYQELVMSSWINSPPILKSFGSL